jgi:hypothetical protein
MATERIGPISSRLPGTSFEEEDTEEPAPPPVDGAALLAQMSPEAVADLQESWGPDWFSYVQ